MMGRPSAERKLIGLVPMSPATRNERLGWVAVRLFYRLNDADIHPEPDAAYELIVEVAGGTIRDVPQIAERLRRWRLA
jgi:prophage maintenance system killer protein